MFDNWFESWASVAPRIEVAKIDTMATRLTPMLSAAELGMLGYRLVLFPISALLAAARTAERVYTGLLRGKPDATIDRVTFKGYNEIVGLDGYLKRD